MGQEIRHEPYFSEADFKEFAERLKTETALLSDWFNNQSFASDSLSIGFEIEACLVDQDMRPAPINEAFLQTMDSPLVVPELARFNVEINALPHHLEGGVFGRIERELNTTLQQCRTVVADMDAHIMTIGVLPSLQDRDLTLENMSSLQRYSALNEQILRLRSGEALSLDIHGREHITARHNDVMLEAAATSLQIHLQVPQEQATRYYNVCRVITAPMVASCANAPFLFGRDLWAETRIPVFEQAVSTPGPLGDQSPDRVTFGERYPHDSLMECFAANVSKYPIMLPKLFDSRPEELAHLRLHNGTIWRWNRPLIGLENGNGPHLRIEHRAVSSPTSVVDVTANMAFFSGLVQSLIAQQPAVEMQLPFSHAQRNFYSAARHGLLADVMWLRGRTVPVYRLLLDDLLPLAHQGLLDSGIDSREADYYLGIIEARLANRQNGAAWQRAFVEKYGRNMRELTGVYYQHQVSGEPVHTWDI